MRFLMDMELLKYLLKMIDKKTKTTQDRVGCSEVRIERLQTKP